MRVWYEILDVGEQERISFMLRRLFGSCFRSQLVVEVFSIISWYATGWIHGGGVWLMSFDTTEYYGGITDSLALRILWNDYHPKTLVSSLLSSVRYDYHHLAASLDSESGLSSGSQRIIVTRGYPAFVGTVTLFEADPATGPFWKEPLVELEYDANTHVKYWGYECLGTIGKPVKRTVTVEQALKEDSSANTLKYRQMIDYIKQLLSSDKSPKNCILTIFA